MGVKRKQIPHCVRNDIALFFQCEEQVINISLIIIHFHCRASIEAELPYRKDNTSEMINNTGLIFG